MPFPSHTSPRAVVSPAKSVCPHTAHTITRCSTLFADGCSRPRPLTSDHHLTMLLRPVAQLSSTSRSGASRVIQIAQRSSLPLPRAHGYATQAPEAAARPPKKFRLSGHALSFLLGSAGTLVLGGVAYHYYSSYVQARSDKPKLGGALDFQRAVRVLCVEFPEEGKVTNEPEDLYDHGFTVNDYHPGVFLFPPSFLALTARSPRPVSELTARSPLRRPSQRHRIS